MRSGLRTNAMVGGYCTFGWLDNFSDRLSSSREQLLVYQLLNVIIILLLYFFKDYDVALIKLHVGRTARKNKQTSKSCFG